MGYNPDEIDEILSRYLGGTSNSESDIKSDAASSEVTSSDKNNTVDYSSIDDILSSYNAFSKSNISDNEASSKGASYNVQTDNIIPEEKTKPEEKIKPEEKKIPEEKKNKKNYGLKMSGKSSSDRGIYNSDPPSGDTIVPSSNDQRRPGLSKAEIIRMQKESIEKEKQKEAEAFKNFKNKSSSRKKSSEKKSEIGRQSYQDKEKQERIKKIKKSNLILNTLLVFFILVFVGSGSYLGYYFYKIKKAETTVGGLKDLIREDGTSTSSAVSPDDSGGSDDNGTPVALTYEIIDGVNVQSKFVDIYKLNSDFIGWINIEGTKIDYPVMHTPSDEQFYLHKDFNKEYSSSGTLFLSAASDAILPSDNVIIYGHNMKAGTMFHTLLEYEKEEFYQEHPYITFDTIDNNGKYEIIAAFRTKIEEDNPNSFKYYEFNTPMAAIPEDCKKEFDDYVAKAKSLTPYNISTTAEYGDKLITLSTCAYHTNEGRYVVVAKKISGNN